jgi:hypothetical protein
VPALKKEGCMISSIILLGQGKSTGFTHDFIKKRNYTSLMGRSLAIKKWEHKINAPIS